MYFSITEYDALTRLGIQDPKSYIRKKFKDEPIAYLTTLCVGKDIISQVEASLDEVLNSGSWFDVMVCSISSSFSILMFR